MPSITASTSSGPPYHTRSRASLSPARSGASRSACEIRAAKRQRANRTTRSGASRPPSVLVAVVAGFIAGAGCTYAPNHFREDGPSTTAAWDSPTAKDIKAQHAPATVRQRGWTETTTASAENGAVAHLPLYFEDPFEDKGHGRTDETNPHDVYRGGWEDYAALAYCPWRFLGNAGLLPVTAILTTPWTIMESDGRLSRQLVWTDHDAERAPHHVFETSPAR